MFICWGWWCWPKTPAQQKVLILFIVDEHSLLSFMCQSYSVFNFISPCALRLEIESETHETWRVKSGPGLSWNICKEKCWQVYQQWGLDTTPGAWQLSNEKRAPGCLGDIGVYTAELDRDCNTILIRTPIQQPQEWKAISFFFGWLSLSHESWQMVGVHKSPLGEHAMLEFKSAFLFRLYMICIHTRMPQTPNPNIFWTPF